MEFFKRHIKALAGTIRLNVSVKRPCYIDLSLKSGPAC